MEEPARGCHARATRGSNPCRSGRTNEAGYLWPVSEPTGSLPNTGATA